jgi:hypothetical protein
MKFDVKALIAVLIVVLVTLSSTRVLDDYVDDYTDESIHNAALTYATARGINGLVSVLQSTEVEAGVIVSGSMTIGEVLDPLNDMIERFSSVMAWVLASLAAQKLLLLLASHQLFLYLLAVLGITSLLLIFYGRSPAQNLVFRCFLMTVFLRFALGLVVVLNSGVDTLFLDQQLHDNDRQIEQFQSSMLGRDMAADADSDAIEDTVIAFWRGLSLDELNRKISAGIESLINLVAIYLLKTIGFPLGFFYVALFIIRRLWQVDLQPTAVL